jgi:hypothetical protein
LWFHKDKVLFVMQFVENIALNSTNIFLYNLTS